MEDYSLILCQLVVTTFIFLQSVESTHVSFHHFSRRKDMTLQQSFTSPTAVLKAIETIAPSTAADRADRSFFYWKTDENRVQAQQSWVILSAVTQDLMKTNLHI